MTALSILSNWQPMQGISAKDYRPILLQCEGELKRNKLAPNRGANSSTGETAKTASQIPVLEFGSGNCRAPLCYAGRRELSAVLSWLISAFRAEQFWAWQAAWMVENHEVHSGICQRVKRQMDIARLQFLFPAKFAHKFIVHEQKIENRPQHIRVSGFLAQSGGVDACERQEFVQLSRRSGKISQAIDGNHFGALLRHSFAHVGEGLFFIIRQPGYNKPHVMFVDTPVTEARRIGKKERDIERKSAGWPATVKGALRYPN
ncbi:MAG: hypothetical protein WCA81_10720 [Rhizomicrobium sp.]|jgi:hypothetical protein